MRLSSPPTLLSLLGVLLTSSHTAHAKPYVRRLQLDLPKALEKRCDNPCGSESQYCCTATETCVTSGWPPIAQCVPGTGSSPNVGAVQQPQQAAGNGQYQLVTTTWTETDLLLRTSTYSIPLASPTQQQATVATPLSCDSSNGESPCGTLCCAVGQYCAMPGQCAASAGGAVGDVSSFYYNSVTATDFVRPTSNTVQTVTSTGSATATVPFQSAGPTQGGATQDGATAGMTTSTTNNGLTGGQIAGIVIGVLLGILLLLLICAFCCFRGIYDGFLAIFGLGKKRRRQETTTYIEERHSHHTGGASRPAGRTWWGANRPARPAKKDSGLGGAGAVAAGLGTLAVILGLKRRRDRKDKESYGSRSSYSYGSYTGTSE
ncbi:MAG: hypothetical protein Q9168_002351, partial [Polycauliona sp. 1 TL-2023]